MSNTDNLQNHIQELIHCLKRSGKTEIAVFFQSTLEEILRGGNCLADTVGSLKSIATMGQYGNFNYDEERHLHGIIDAAIHWTKNRNEPDKEQDS